MKIALLSWVDCSVALPYCVEDLQNAYSVLMDALHFSVYQAHQYR